MKSKNFSFKGWDTITWLLGRKKMLITAVGMICAQLMLNPDLTGLLAGGAVFEGAYAMLEYFVKKYK